jgi:hypothetical protein
MCRAQQQRLHELLAGLLRVPADFRREIFSSAPEVCGEAHIALSDFQPLVHRLWRFQWQVTDAARRRERGWGVGRRIEQYAFARNVPFDCPGVVAPSLDIACAGHFGIHEQSMFGEDGVNGPTDVL